MEELLPAHPRAWAEIQETEINIESSDGAETLIARYSYSKQGPSHLELIQRVPSSVWDADSRYFHHVGYWVSDLAAASNQLESSGFIREAIGGPTDLDEPIFTYHVAPSGARLELVSETFEEALNDWIQGK